MTKKMEDKILEFIRGMVRPVATFALVGAIIYGFVVKLIEPQVFVPLVILALVFWFESRENAK